MPPAVKGVQQAHCLFLIVCGTAFHDGAGQNLDQSASQRIDDHSDQNPDKSIRHKLRQDHQPQKACRRKQMRCYNTGPVSDPVHKACRKQIH